MDKLTWKTELRKVSELKEYSKNPRQILKNQFDQLIKSIKKFDYVELVAIDVDNTIIAGHMRIRALKKLKRDKELIEIRVPSRKLTEEEFEEYLIRSNLNTGDFDYDVLANAYNPINLLEYGFTEEQLIGSAKEGETAAMSAQEECENKCEMCGQKIKKKQQQEKLRP